MSLTRTLLQLRTDLRARADQVSSTYRADSVCNRYLSESCRSLVSRLVDEYEELYWATSATVNTTANQLTTELPSDFWKLVTTRVELNGRRDPLRKADLADLDREATSRGGWTVAKPGYRIMGRQLYWEPIPRAVHTVTLYYVPTGIFFSTGGTPISEFAADTDYFDGVFGWESWVVLDAAIKLTNDEGGKRDQTRLLEELGRRWEEIAISAANQHGADPSRVQGIGRPAGDYYDPTRYD